MLNKQSYIITNIGFRWVSVFTLFFIFSFPFPHNILPNLGTLLNVPFQFLTPCFGYNVLEINEYTTQFYSDSTGLYIHVLLLFFISFFIALASVFVKVNVNYLTISKNVFFVFISYYLGSVLLMYGFDKVFKHQFYLPEPNTLYTPIGDLSKDIAFWSIMGASRSYSVFAGSIEVVPALLLIFNRTRLLGALIGLMVLINVTMLNFSFDISVKIFSLFLVFLSLILVCAKGKSLINFFVLGKTIPIEAVSNSLKNSKLKLLNLLVVLFLLSDSLYPYIQANTFNDDVTQRPLYHGAYHIDSLKMNEGGQDINIDYVNLFIHRKGYLILQTSNNNFIDYKLYVDEVNKQFTLVDYNKKGCKLNYYTTNEILSTIKGKIGENNIEIKLTELNWKQIPLLNYSFNWTHN